MGGMQVVPAWLGCLPLRGDLVEAKIVHEQLCSMAERYAIIFLKFATKSWKNLATEDIRACVLEVLDWCFNCSVSMLKAPTPNSGERNLLLLSIIPALLWADKTQWRRTRSFSLFLLVSTHVQLCLQVWSPTFRSKQPISRKSYLRICRGKSSLRLPVFSKEVFIVITLSSILKWLSRRICSTVCFLYILSSFQQGCFCSPLYIMQEEIAGPVIRDEQFNVVHCFRSLCWLINQKGDSLLFRLLQRPFTILFRKSHFQEQLYSLVQPLRVVHVRFKWASSESAVSSLLQVLGAGTDLATEQTAARMVGLLRRLLLSLPPEALASTWSTLQPQQQATLQSILSSPASWDRIHIPCSLLRGATFKGYCWRS